MSVIALGLSTLAAVRLFAGLSDWYCRLLTGFWHFFHVYLDVLKVDILPSRDLIGAAVDLPRKEPSVAA